MASQQAEGEWSLTEEQRVDTVDRIKGASGGCRAVGTAPAAGCGSGVALPASRRALRPARPPGAAADACAGEERWMGACETAAAAAAAAAASPARPQPPPPPPAPANIASMAFFRGTPIPDAAAAAAAAAAEKKAYTTARVEARTTTQRAARDERVEGRAAKPAAGRRAQVGAMASMVGAGVWAGGGEGVRGRGWWVGGWERGRDCGGSGGNRSLLCRRVAGAAWGSARATRGGVCIFCPRSHTQQFAVFAGSCTTFAHCSGTQG